LIISFVISNHMPGIDILQNKMGKSTINKDNILIMKKIGKSFSGIKVLDDVYFDLKPGEVHILAGENGAGKTTLIKILAGVYADYVGEIILDGNPIKFKSPYEAANHGISAIHQEMSLINTMSVSDNIFLGREITRKGFLMDYKTQRKKAQSLLKQIGIHVDLSLPVSYYPLSIRQMIEIAKALVSEARIIIMDEPTSALNSLEVNRLFNTIYSLKKSGCGIIYISHRIEEIYTIADRISVLRDGKYIGTSTAKELPRDNLIQWMVGRKISQQFPKRSSSLGKERLKVEHLFVSDPSETKKWVVEDITFSVCSGEILGIAGLQGSGKSELFHGLFGSFGKSYKGEIYVDGDSFKARSPKNSIERGLILLTNDRKRTGLIPHMNIVRNVTLASLSKFLRKGWIKENLEEKATRKHVKSLNIKFHSLEQEVDTLSGGNQQKVVLAKWLETEPKILLLDEPTIGVDVGVKHDIYSLMNQWTAQGLAICLITSELPELLAMCDRILVMHRGKAFALFSKEDATQERIMQAALGERITQ